MKRIIQLCVLIAAAAAFAFAQTQSPAKAKHGLRVLPGVVVTGVPEGSPEEAAGIKVGDVITAVNDQPVIGLREYVKMVTDAQPGTTIRFAIRRPFKKQLQQFEAVMVAP